MRRKLLDALRLAMMEHGELYPSTSRAIRRTRGGMSVFACDPAEAARLSDDDPSVMAGRLAYDVMKWWVRAGSLAFPLTDSPLGDRCSMPD